MPNENKKNLFLFPSNIQLSDDSETMMKKDTVIEDTLSKQLIENAKINEESWLLMTCSMIQIEDL